MAATGIPQRCTSEPIVVTIDTIRKGAGGRSLSARHKLGSCLPKLLAASLSAFIWLKDTIDRRRSRRALLALTDAQLKDVGISRADAEKEARRSWWL